MLVSGETRTVSELQETVRRQQQQIESQRRQIVAKEAHLRQLKQEAEQQAKDRQKLAEHRQQVEERERKLIQLRSLRGEALSVKASNSSLCTTSFEYFYFWSINLIIQLLYMRHFQLSLSKCCRFNFSA